MSTPAKSPPGPVPTPARPLGPDPQDLVALALRAGAGPAWTDNIRGLGRGLGDLPEPPWPELAYTARAVAFLPWLW